VETEKFVKGAVFFFSFFWGRSTHWCPKSPKETIDFTNPGGGERILIPLAHQEYAAEMLFLWKKDTFYKIQNSKRYLNT